METLTVIGCEEPLLPDAGQVTVTVGVPPIFALVR